MADRPLTEDQRLAINAKALGNIAVHPWTESGLYPGITLRQLFAALAMQGLRASDFIADSKEVAQMAIEDADALLKELAK